MDTKTVIKEILIGLVLEEMANGSFTREIIFTHTLREIEKGREFTDRDLSEFIFNTYFEDSLGRLELNFTETETHELRHWFGQLLEERCPEDFS